MSCSAPNLTDTHQFTAFCVLNSLHIENHVSWKKLEHGEIKKDLGFHLESCS